MKRVHVAPTLLDAQLAIDALAGVGIAAHILNAHAAGALGDLPFLNAEPEVWVDDDAKASAAREVLASLLSAPQRSDRHCRQCGEMNPGNFLSCWQCGAVLPDQDWGS